MAIGMIGLIAVGVIGVLAIVIGLVGRRVGDHPICRRCRFDLRGVVPEGPAVAGSAATRCPECGSDLSARGAVRLGLRRRRPLLLAMGALLTLVVLGGLGVGVYRTIAANPYAYAPTWYLQREVVNATPGVGLTPIQALGELAQRIAAGRVSADRVSAIVERALKQQALPAAMWNPAWGDVIEAAWQVEMLTPEQLRRYVEQIQPQFSLTMPSRFVMGEKAEFRLDMRAPKTGSGKHFVLWLEAHLADVRTESGTPLLPLDAEVSGLLGLQGTSSGSLTGRVALDVPPGDIRLVPTWDLAIIRLSHEALSSGKQFARPPPVWTGAFSASIWTNAVTPGTPLVRAIDDPSLTADLVQRLRFRSVNARKRDADGNVPVHVVFLAERPPKSLAFDVLARVPDPGATGTRDVPVGGPLLFRAGDRGGYGGRLVIPADIIRPTMTFVLRSNPAAAEGAVGIDEIWGGELVFEDVKIEGVPEAGQRP